MAAIELTCALCHRRFIDDLDTMPECTVGGHWTPHSSTDVPPPYVRCCHQFQQEVKRVDPETMPYEGPSNFAFAGWKFRDTGLHQTQGLPYRSGQLLLDRRLLNPDPPEAFLSYHFYNERFYSREMAAAWLIAHWWEHALHSCACQVDDAKPSRFRAAMIETLLAMESKSRTTHGSLPPDGRRY